MRKRQNRRRRGFTLLELMLVLAILVVLGGVVLVNIGNFQDDAYRKTTETRLQALKQNVLMYRIKVNTLPESLEDLVDGPSDPQKKAAFGAAIIDEVPKDAWENDLQYTLTGNKFEIRSNGADGQPGNDDDVVIEG